MLSDCAERYSPSQCADARWGEDNVVSFRAEPNCGRGTVGIVWKCLIVIAFSAWSVIHIDTKPLARHRAGLFWKPWNKIFRKDPKQLESTPLHGPTARKLFEALTTLLFPEYGVLKAVEELVVARFIQYTTIDVDGWEAFSLKQAHLVRMGGIDIPYIAQPEDFAQFVLHNARVLDYSCFPSNRRISLRAKRDFVDKLVAGSQVVYFLSTIATRSRHSYRISFLEILTLNYILLASVTFLLRIRKPQELYEAFELDLAELPSPTSSPKADSAQHPTIEKWIWVGTTVAITVASICPFVAMPGRKDFWIGAHQRSAEGSLSVVSMVGFSAIITFMLRRRLERHRWNQDTLLKKFLWYLSVLILYLCGLFYVLTRVWLWASVILNTLVVEEGIYLTPPSWTSYLPHVGA